MMRKNNNSRYPRLGQDHIKKILRLSLIHFQLQRRILKMKTLVVLLMFSVFLVLQFYHANGFSFPSIIDDARDAMMKFSTGRYTVSKKTPVTSHVR